MDKNSSSMTMKDIARELGVSVATVSRALKDSPRISKEKRELIKEFASKHDFSPNMLAESLRNSKVRPTKVIGVILPQYTHFYFSSVMAGIDEMATKHGYVLMVAQSGEDYNREVDICKKFLDNKVCGIILSQSKNTSQYDHFRKLLAAGLPLVFFDRICTGIEAARVVVDDYQGAYNATMHLIETGCRRIAFFGAPKNLEISKNRYNGYLDALRKNGLQPDDRFVKVCDNRDDAEAVTFDMLQQEDIPDAFFAINDETAIGIMATAKRLGYRIPEDISVCGFTNSSQSLACDPMLTTVEQRGVDIGREAADILIKQVEGILPTGKIEKRIVKTRLIVRESTR